MPQNHSVPETMAMVIDDVYPPLDTDSPEALINDQHKLLGVAAEALLARALGKVFQ